MQGSEIGGYPDDNPKTAHGALKVPLHLVPPALLVHTAQAFANGAGKYGAYNWRTKRISSSVYYAAALRHLVAWWDGEDIDPESGAHHLGHLAACAAMILDSVGGELNDDRPRPGPAPALLARASRPAPDATADRDARVAAGFRALAGGRAPD